MKSLAHVTRENVNSYTQKRAPNDFTEVVDVRVGAEPLPPSWNSGTVLSPPKMGGPHGGPSSGLYFLDRPKSMEKYRMGRSVQLTCDDRAERSRVRHGASVCQSPSE